MWLVAPRFRKLLRRLDADEGGNVIVIYVAASMLLVAMVWAIIGTGVRVTQHETIQSSADAAAFSASVIKAKGLNIIAFCNLIMALLLALVMLLRAIKYVLMGLAAFITACAASIVGTAICAPLVGPVDNFAFNVYPNLEDKAERLIRLAMDGLHYTERAVAHITPVLAFVEAYHIGTDDAYKKNFGSGSLVTIAWPLPIEELPVKDGTCQNMADNAVQYIKDISNLILGKILSFLPGGSKISGFLSSGIAKLAGPLAGTLCGGSMDETITEKLTDCNACLNADNVVGSQWIGNEGVTENDQIGGKFKTPDQSGATCNMKSMPSGFCNKSPKQLVCDQDGHVWNWLQFQSCTIQRDGQVTGSSDWPLPLVFADDWKKKVDTRAYTVLTDTNMDQRRQSVAIAEKQSQRTAAPMVNKMLGMAEAEWTAWNGHEDLWHMDWRARLVPFTFGSTSGGDNPGDTGDVPSGSAGVVSEILNDVKGKTGLDGLSNQFLLH
jgi:hypothetical protein